MPAPEALGTRPQSWTSVGPWQQPPGHCVGVVEGAATVTDEAVRVGLEDGRDLTSFTVSHSPYPGSDGR